MQWSSLVSPTTLITTHWRVAGWACFPRVATDVTAPDQSPTRSLWGPTSVGRRDGEREEEGEGELGGNCGARVSVLHAGWQAMHQKMTAPPFFLK